MILHKIWLKCKTRKNFFIERRKYLRLDISIPVSYSVVTKGKHTLSHPAEYLTNSKNIGGGGLMLEVPLLVDEFLMTKKLLKVEMDLTDGEPRIHAIAKIICVEHDEHDDMYYLRLEFIEISEEDKDRIIEFVGKRGKGK
ncbi:MAG: PilZ domain-containing protein [Candidatus Omnitrophota bacterium]